jgi:DNA-binding MltR family transcriptional regulator
MAKIKKVFDIPELSADSQRFIEDLQNESDRGCALIGASFLDKILESILRTYFVQNKKIVNYLMKNDGPIGSFSSKIKLAYSLGLLGIKQYRDLEKIREIRNIVAHQDCPVTFNMIDVKNRCQSLELPKVVPLHGRVTSRDYFVIGVVLLSNQLLLTGLSLKHCTHRKDFELAEVVKV